MANKQKVFHANLLKRYYPAVQPELSSTYSSAQDMTVASAAILEPEEEFLEHGT